MTKWRIILMGGLALAAMPASATIRAVFVGIDKYQFSNAGLRKAGLEVPASGGFDDLSGAVGDTMRMKAALASLYGVPDDQPAPGGCESASDTSITLTDGCATKAAILAAWDRAIDAGRPGDTLILYFAGHGSRFFDDQTMDQVSRYNSTIMASDARRPGAQAGADILDSEVREVIDRATSRGIRVVTWFDSCNSGTASRDGQSASRSAPKLTVRGLAPMRSPAQYGALGAWRVHIGAAGDGEDAREVGSVGKRAGVFTTALINALTATPRASFADIAATVVTDVAATTKGRQVPHAEGALRATIDGPEVKVPTFAVVRDGNGLLMTGGQLVGVTRGSLFALYGATTDALRAGDDAPLLIARVASVTAGQAVLTPDGPVPATLPGRLVAREHRHDFGGTVIGLAVAEPAALPDIRKLDFVKVDSRGPFSLAAGPGGTELRGRGGVLLATLPAANAPEFGLRLGAALEKVARVEAWLAGLRARPGVSLCAQNVAAEDFDPKFCPEATGGRTLRQGEKMMLSIINETDAPRVIRVLGIDERYEVMQLLPARGAIDGPLDSGQALRPPPGTEIRPTDPGEITLVALSSDGPLDATVLEQTSTDTVDLEACRSAVARVFCQGGDTARAGGTGAVGNWSAAILKAKVVP